MREKILVMIFVIAVFLLIYIAYSPMYINTSLKGLYIDRNNLDFNEHVNVVIDGRVKKNFLLQPESFYGTISINDSILELPQKVIFDKVRKTIRLTLDKESKNILWKFDDKSNLFKKFENNVYFMIYLDKKLSKITFVPFFYNGNGSSSYRISAPCEDREDVLNLSSFLNSGGIE
ncbi:hypothetical protein [Sedimentibacter sp.]|uniref:hypothetical protein n=1 Tax=Sedimentibacter sp. TaxID=1960295 RepID=UPI0028A8AC3F|nr:hypothetical protein [Sedimentibacter sp.]